MRKPIFVKISRLTLLVVLVVGLLPSMIFAIDREGVVPVGNSTLEADAEAEKPQSVNRVLQNLILQPLKRY